MSETQDAMMADGNQSGILRKECELFYLLRGIRSLNLGTLHVLTCHICFGRCMFIQPQLEPGS